MYYLMYDNDDVKSFFALWGQIEWAGAELNGIGTWEPPAFQQD